VARARALVINPVIDVKKLGEVLDKIVLNATITGKIQAQLRNTAIVKNEDGPVYLLFNFLDKGTQPHWIGEADTLLANQAKDFGPVWGPVYHPGSKPHDISARVDAFMQGYLESYFTGIHTAPTKDDSIQWRAIRSGIVGAMQKAADFAAQITPDSWASVKQSYEVYVNGRKV
jgi:hypothetical protein